MFVTRVKTDIDQRAIVPRDVHVCNGSTKVTSTLDKRGDLFTGNPLPNPGHNCAFLDTAGQHTWQSSSCSKKLGYICYKDGPSPAPPESKEKHAKLFTHFFYNRNAVSVWSATFAIFIQSSFPSQLSKGFVPTHGFPTTATAFISIVLLKLGPMLRKSAAKKGETSSASTTWRSRALLFLNLDSVCQNDEKLASPHFF